jgi:lactate dehydrogenase-like 2-hydroxyacid dehydrogenase
MSGGRKKVGGDALADTRAKPFDVLMPGAGPGIVAADIIAERLPMHRLWLKPDAEAWLAEWAPRLRAVASSGHQFPIDATFMSRLPHLEIVASFGVGYEHVDAKWAAERGVIVTHTPGVLDDEVADTAMALTLMAVRCLPQAERFLRAGEWLQSSFPLTASLRGATMGVLGLGRIGKAIARRAEGFGLNVVYHGRKPQPDVPHRFYPSLIEMAKASNILIAAAPGGEATRHIVDADVLRALGGDGVFVNISRGSLVDEAALIEALRTGTILAAGLDVFENEPHVPAELIALDNAVLLPHVGSASFKTRRAMGECVAANLFAWAEGKPPLTPVPETPWRGRWGEGGDPRDGRTARPGSQSKRGDVASGRAGLIAAISAVMRDCWDLPADCNEGELFSYAEALLDRIEAGGGKDALYPFLADVQVKNLEMPMSDAYKEIVDRSIDLVGAG